MVEHPRQEGQKQQKLLGKLSFGLTQIFHTQLIRQLHSQGQCVCRGEVKGGGGDSHATHHHKAHLAHGLLVVVVHLADQGVAQVHGDALDGLVLAAGVEDAQQELVDPAVLELQLLGDAKVAQGQAAVALHLGRAGGKARGGQGPSSRDF